VKRRDEVNKRAHCEISLKSVRHCRTMTMRLGLCSAVAMAHTHTMSCAELCCSSSLPGP
jgi:hypothetical protein